MAKDNAMPAGDPDQIDILKSVRTPKIRMKKTPAHPGRIIVKETRVDIDALLKQAMETMTINEPPNLNMARELSRISLKAEDSFTPGRELFRKKYEEKEIIVPNYVSVLSGETSPQEVEFDYGKVQVYGFSTSGLEKASGRHPENVNGIVLKETPGRYLTAVMLAGSEEKPETAALTNAASAYAANDLHLNEEERFPLNFEALSAKTAPIAGEMGLEDAGLKGLTARLDLKTYTLDVSGNTDDIHCLVIDPKTGSMESYNNIKGQEYKESQLLNADWQRLKKMAETEYQGEKKAKILSNIARIEEEGLSDDEKKKLLARLPLPKQISIKMPVSSGEVVLIANAKLLKALKAKAPLPGLVQMITEGIAKGKKLQQICRELMSTVTKKEEEYEIEEASRSLVAFRVP